MRFFRVIKEIKNFIDYKRIIRKESLDSPIWSKLRLRKDWIPRIYTVINLPPTITESKDFPREARPAYVMDEIAPINDYIGFDLNLNEVTTMAMKEVDGTRGDSYLVVWFFLFRELSILYILRILSIWALAIAAIIKWETIYLFLSEHTLALYDKILSLF